MFPPQIINVFLILLVIKLTDGQSCLDIIDPSYVNVEFTPLVRSPSAQFLYGYTIKDIQTMIELASTRFQKFFCEALATPGRDDEPVFRSILKLMAEFNLLHNKKLEVTLSSDLSYDLNETLNLVNETNLIHPGTVKRVMLGVSETQASNNSTLVYLKEAEKSFSELKIETGIKIKLSQCDKYKRLRSGLNIYSKISPLIELSELPQSVTLPEATWKLLIFVDFVVFTPNSVFVIHDSPPETSMGYLTKQFEICSAAVKWAGHKVDVQFGFAWCSKGDGLEQDANHLVQYWKLLGNWAKGRGRKKDVYLQRAFDTPILNGTKDMESVASQGWWRIVNPDSRNITKENFKEKFCDLSISEQKIIKSKQNLDYTFKKYESTGESGNCLVLIIIWIFVIMTNVSVIVCHIIKKASRVDGGSRGQGLTSV